MSRTRAAAIFIAVAILVAGALYLAKSDKNLERDTDFPIVQPNETQSAARQIVAQPDGKDDGFQFDLDRLYDLSYEVDPELIEFAASIGVSPGCLIQTVRANAENKELPVCGGIRATERNEHMLLPGTYEKVCRDTGTGERCHQSKVADHPYESLSDDELRALADTSAEAAVLLARRMVDPLASRDYYERAMVLSGKAGPLEEWMYQKNAGGLQWVDGKLDIQRAKSGFGVYALTARLGYGAQSLERYRQVLIDHDIDTTSLEKLADEEFERLTLERQALTANPWPE